MFWHWVAELNEMNEITLTFFILLLLIYLIPAEPEEKPKDILNNTMPESKDTGEVHTRRMCMFVFEWGCIIHK